MGFYEIFYGGNFMKNHIKLTLATSLLTLFLCSSLLVAETEKSSSKVTNVSVTKLKTFPTKFLGKDVRISKVSLTRIEKHQDFYCLEFWYSNTDLVVPFPTRNEPFYYVTEEMAERITDIISPGSKYLVNLVGAVFDYKFKQNGKSITYYGINVFKIEFYKNDGTIETIEE